MKWQTRWTQNPVPARACRFESDLRHQSTDLFLCDGGGIGRRARLRGVWATVRVQVPSFAPSQLVYKPFAYRPFFFVFRGKTAVFCPNFALTARPTVRTLSRTVIFYWQKSKRLFVQHTSNSIVPKAVPCQIWTVWVVEKRLTNRACFAKIIEQRAFWYKLSDMTFSN